MRLAVLLWIYRDVEVCVNRARWLRLLNPGTPVYCLYGGPVDRSSVFAEALSGLVDDFHVFGEPWDSRRKWMEGDKLVSAWHRDRGVRLEWDSIFIAQWDMAVLEPVGAICSGLEPERVMLPGVRPVSEVASFWNWVQPADGHLADYEAFCSLLRDRGEMPEDPMCCNFLAAVLPRSFLDRYAAEAPESGFLEYKVPMMAQAWGFRFDHGHGLDPMWMFERRRSRFERWSAVLHAERHTVPTPVLLAHALSRSGSRVFHPYHRRVPTSLAGLMPGASSPESSGLASSPCACA